MKSFDDMADRFTNRVRFASNWKGNYYGAAHSTRLRRAVEELKDAIREVEEHPGMKDDAT